MKVLLIGAGGVSEEITKVGQCRPWREQMVLADCDVVRARRVQNQLGRTEKFPQAKIKKREIRQVIQGKYGGV